MTFVAKGFAAIAVLGLAACAAPGQRPTDTGSMALPAPVATGTMTRPAVQGPPDTGSMNTPAPIGGVVRAAPVGPDTGSMALPNAALGNSRPR